MSTEMADLSGLLRAPPPAPRSTVPAPKRRVATRVIFPTVLFGTAAGALLYAGRDALSPAATVEVVPAIVKSGVRQTSGASVSAPGWVEADPFARAVSALADGVVKEVLALEGEHVAAGQVVARLVDDDARLGVQRAEAEVGMREAALATAQAALQAAQREWDNPVELTRKLRTAEADLAEKQAELDRWPSELAADEALEAELAAEDKRVSQVYEQGASSEIEFIKTRQQYLAQKARVAATRARKAVLEAQILGLRADVTAATDNLRLRIPETRALDEARAAVQQAGAALANARAALEEARLRLSRMEIVSPVEGVVMNRLVEPGSKLMLQGDMARSATVLRLYDPARLQVRVDVPLGSAAEVGVGQEAEVVVDVLPDRTFKGRVTRMVHEADIQKNTLQVKVAIEAPTAEIKPEMLARVKLLPRVDSAAPAERHVVFAPAALIHKGADGRSIVWLVNQSEKRAEARAVVPGTVRMGDWVEVSDGLHPGDWLIAGDVSRLTPGQRVTVAGEARLASDAGAHAGHGS